MIQGFSQCGFSGLSLIEQTSDRHRALNVRHQRIHPPARRIVLPDRLTVCGGPSLPAALDWLGAALMITQFGSGPASLKN